jgi:dTMP kinase
MLIAVEGVSGAGKGTMIDAIVEHLRGRGARVFVTHWNSDDVVSPVIGELKYRRGMSPMLWCTLHAAEMRRRYLVRIAPWMRDNPDSVVVADRWMATAIVRDGLRSVPAATVRALYSYLPEPDVTLYLDAPVAVALDRRLRRHSKLYHYSSGADIYHDDPLQSFRRYLHDQRRSYQAIRTSRWVSIDADQPAADVANDATAEIDRRMGWV